METSFLRAVEASNVHVRRPYSITCDIRSSIEALICKQDDRSDSITMKDEAWVVEAMLRHMYGLEAWPKLDIQNLDDIIIETEFRRSLTLMKAIEKVRQVPASQEFQD